MTVAGGCGQTHPSLPTQILRDSLVSNDIALDPTAPHEGAHLFWHLIRHSPKQPLTAHVGTIVHRVEIGAALSPSGSNDTYCRVGVAEIRSVFLEDQRGVVDTVPGLDRYEAATCPLDFDRSKVFREESFTEFFDRGSSVVARLSCARPGDAMATAYTLQAVTCQQLERG